MADEIRDIILKIGYCKSVKDDFPEYFLIFKDLFHFHPMKKAENMTDLKIKK